MDPKPDTQVDGNLGMNVSILRDLPRRFFSTAQERDGIVRVISWGGIGDALLATPAIRTLRLETPRRIYVYCSNRAHLEVFRHNPAIDRLSMLAAAPIDFVRFHLLPRHYHLLDVSRLAASLYFPGHVSRLIADMLGVTLKDEQMELFLSGAERAEARRLLGSASRPVALHVTPACSSNKAWPLQSWRELVSRNPQFTFFQIGSHGEAYVEGAVDLRGKVSLRGAFAVIQEAHLFVGIDSCMAHAASATGTPGVVLFGPTSLRLWGNTNNLNVNEDVPCSPCDFLLGPQPCPYGCRCMELLSVEKVEAALAAASRRRQ